MRKSSKITVAVVAAMGMTACNRERVDPCEAATFNEQACNDAVRNHGYHYRGAWVPMYYSHPYPYYYDSYRGYVARGGAVRSATPNVYSAPSPHSSGVSRGGFGSTGSSHASGSGAGA
jgi:hypothetical protein